MAFVLPFFPPDGRFLGASNSFNDPSHKNRLTDEVARAIREHTGPFYSLTAPAGSGNATLNAHGLRRVSDGCAFIVSNMSPDPFELCLLKRIHSPGQMPPG